MVTETSVVRPRIVGVGTANPPTSYTQEEILKIYQIEDPKLISLFQGSHIERRYLHLPAGEPGTVPPDERQGQLLLKHRTDGIEMAGQALRNCLKKIDADLEDIGYLACVTSTGWLTPGFSALLIKELGIPRQCSRLDVVGMGCNAGLNGLNPVASWAMANPGKLAIMICVEVCSAAYAFDGTMRTAVVNSLFGDGAAAVALKADPAAGPGPKRSDRPGPRVLKFASYLVHEAIEAMRYDWDDHHGKYSFYIDRDVPYVVGANAENILDGLLEDTGVRRSQISHWLVHSGGKKVVDSVKINLGLTTHDVRHTTSVLHDYGNLSSGSFLFSYERLVDEGRVQPGDYGVMMTMGPGSTIEMALIGWDW
jgi:alkylresorcinol/alkylpyrone synthase/polyketide synthase Type III